ncbi:kinase-like domain-containing protein [Phaeosphaeriaceae sp. PMI808]|nr:kinase-like domain-containing protein [Phaeosphaeriaceae sp. PMI808]
MSQCVIEAVRSSTNQLRCAAAGVTDLRVNERYRLLRRLGKGGFGYVYEATDLQTDENVAIKLESIDIDPSILQEEVRVYAVLRGEPGIPRVHWYGTECDFNAMVFDLLGPSLEDLFNFCSRKFSLKTVLMLADQLISRLQQVHSKGIIHRDIKPENFLMGTGKQGNLLYMTDLGLSTEYRKPTSDSASARQWNMSLIGTARYASINAHSGVEQSRLDDMESLGYVMLYFIRGSLPWQGLKTTSDEQKAELILEKKKSMNPEELCVGLPDEFAKYFHHVLSLRFGDEPDYQYLRKIFKTLFVAEGFEYDNVFDWTVLKFLMASENPSAPKR